MWYYNKETGNFSVGSIPTKEVDGGIEEDSGWVQIADRPEPYDDYIFDGSYWVQKIAQVVVPQSITPRQARLSLLQATLLDEVETLLANDKAMQIWWEYSLEVNRNHKHIITMATALGLSENQLDELFILGESL